MKALHKSICILTLSICILHSANAQYNAANGVFDNAAQPAVSTAKAATNNGIDTASTACNGNNTFWAVNFANSRVKEYNLTGSVITLTGNSISGCPGYSLAACNNLNGGAVSPTFYTSYNNDAWYWNGDSTWVQINQAPFNIINAGAYNNNLYYISNGGSGTDVYKYDGVSYSNFYHLNQLFSVADLAVDMYGNVYVITCATLPFTDSVYVISPSAQIVAQHPLVFNTFNAYGCFLLNNVLYVGIGPNNTVTPNTLLPITFSATAATVGTPISMPMPFDILNDLAGCSPGSPLGINSITNVQNISLSPNPATENIGITTTATPNTTYAIYNAEGKMVVSPTTITTGTTNVNVSHLSKGVYFVEIKNDRGVVRSKFMKM